MKIGVLGLWHLGCVTAACLARHFEVVGLDFDEALVGQLQKGKAPLFEPGLDDLLREGLASGRLSFQVPSAETFQDWKADDLLWITYDTPVDEEDRSDIGAVLKPLRRCAGWLRPGSLVAISSQLPAGTCRSLEEEFRARAIDFACIPENLRLGQALAIFSQPERIVAGVRTDLVREKLRPVLERFSSNILWMRPESAEMTKHALNSFLALSITFMNEVSTLCEQVGADGREVSLGLKSEPRIGPRSYLSPGGPYAGGTLARDIVSLENLAAAHGAPLEVLPAVRRSNEQHKLWAWRKLQARLAPLHGRTVAVFGLTYKPGTDTLRRSSSVELCQRLAGEGVRVRAWDPLVHELPDSLRTGIELGKSPEATLEGADALVVATPWPEFRTYAWPQLVTGLKQPMVLDAGSYLREALSTVPGVNYLAVGGPHEA